ncbi:MAG: AhpC/TSA family protein [Prevotella sp.]|nr:AhpC/TSA family protein [Prevotella sp.]
MMNRLFLLAFGVLALTGCTDNKNFTIDGIVEGADGKTLYLYNKTLGGAELMDSVVLDESGVFAFKGDAPEAPDFYLLVIGNQVINLSIDSTETVSVKAKMPGMASNYEVEGSDNCEKIRELALRQQDLQRQALALESNYSFSETQRIDSLERLVENYKADISRDYIFQEPQKAYAYFALFQTLGRWTLFDRSNANDMKAFGAVATCWNTYYPDALRTEHLRNTALKGINERRAVVARENNVIDETKIIDAGIIELQLPDASGNIRTLGELKGKVVLLDFHFYGTKESASRILLLRDLYNKYHDKGLEIYQVGLDDNEHFWKQQTSQLPWVCVFDPECTSLPLYNVPEVPEFFTIDRNSQLQKRSTQMTDGVEAELRRLL